MKARKSLVQINPNELYYNIWQIEKDRYYERKEQGEYGAPLLKGSERRLRACMRKQEGQIRLSLTLNRDAITYKN